jgi:uncharacterized protein YbjQ (UPF0145 family)
MVDILITTTDFITGYKIEKVLGVAIGNTVRAKHLGKDIIVGLKKLVGGELEEYTDMLKDARMEAINRMVKEAKNLGADAVINVRFMTSAVTQGAAEILVYGSAVKLKKA